MAIAPLALVLGGAVPAAAGDTAPVVAAAGPNAQQEQLFGSGAGTQSFTPDPSLPPLGSTAPRTRSADTSTATTQRTATVSAGPVREVFGFAPYWNLGDWQEWQYSLMTTVAYFGISLDGNGNAAADSGLSGWNSSDMTGMVNAAHSHANRVLLTIKCMDTSTIGSILSSDAHQQTAIATTVGFLQQRGLDGVAVDFEPTGSGASGSQFTTFISRLASAVRQSIPGSEVVVATYGASAGENGFFDIPALAGSVDAFFVMSYDMSFSNTWGNAGPNAPLQGPWQYTGSSEMQQYAAVVPRSKVILGVPYYGYKWSTTSTQPYAAWASPSNQGADTYASMFDDFTCSCVTQVQQHWDGTASSPWATWYSPSYGGWRELYYENADSLAAKYDLVNGMGLRGVGIWALGYDTGHTELWDLLAQKFSPEQGYWMVALDGGVFAFGASRFFGSMGGTALNRPMVGIAGTPSGRGYWTVASDGGVFSFGDAHFFGSTGSIALNQPIVGMARTRDGQGYWLVASDGGIFAFGDAPFHGSTGNIHLNQPIVAMAPTPDDGGYWLVASDGGVFAFGDAAFRGSMGGTRLNQPVVGMAAAPDGGGYWMLARDGGIFAFGTAGFHGSMGGQRLNAPMVTMASSPSGGGYWTVASDGGVFAYGDAAFQGSMGGQRLAQPIAGMSTP